MKKKTEKKTQTGWRFRLAEAAVSASCGMPSASPRVVLGPVSSSRPPVLTRTESTKSRVQLPTGGFARARPPPVLPPARTSEAIREGKVLFASDLGRLKADYAAARQLALVDEEFAEHFERAQRAAEQAHRRRLNGRGLEARTYKELPLPRLESERETETDPAAAASLGSLREEAVSAYFHDYLKRFGVLWSYAYDPVGRDQHTQPAVRARVRVQQLVPRGSGDPDIPTARVSFSHTAAAHVDHTSRAKKEEAQREAVMSATAAAARGAVAAAAAARKSGDMAKLAANQARQEAGGHQLGNQRDIGEDIERGPPQRSSPRFVAGLADVPEWMVLSTDDDVLRVLRRLRGRGPFQPVRY
jgi:hypothetical protein